MKPNFSREAGSFFAQITLAVPSTHKAPSAIQRIALVFCSSKNKKREIDESQEYPHDPTPFRPSDGMADIQDLKSWEVYPSCGFESRLGHF
jgi:hypothetical protein